jgi:hypothetical protein
MFHKTLSSALTTIVAVVVVFSTKGSESCDAEFHGFGVYLGSTAHFNGTDEKTVRKVLDKVYHDLKIR